MERKVYKMDDRKLDPSDEIFTDYEFEPIFKIGLALYVPHYTTPGVWVGVGNVMKKTSELLAMQAVPEVRYMWKRIWTSGIFKDISRHVSREELKHALAKYRAPRPKRSPTNK
jgi:hypothetical protein